jgi:hypothetical protein
MTLDLSSRNRRNKARGHSFERWVVEQFRRIVPDTRRTGPLGGKDDVIVGALWAVQCKKTGRPVYRPAIRRYLDALRLLFPTRIPMVAYARPGNNRAATLTLYEGDWADLHGPGTDIALTRDGNLVTVPLLAFVALHGALDDEPSDVVGSVHE